MTKQEYFSKRLKRDFIKYALLQTPRFSPHEVSDKLRKSLDTDHIYFEMKKEIPEVANKFLSLDLLKDKKGVFVKELPDWLTPDITKTIVEEYRRRIERNFTKETYLPILISMIEKLTWAQGVDDMAENLKIFLAGVKAAATQYANIPQPDHIDYGIKEKYEAARRVTLRERIMGDNDKDVLIFRSALLGYAQELCEVEMYNQLAKLYEEVVETPELLGMITSFEMARHQAEAELAVLSTLQGEKCWEDEYNHLIPIDFFERNIEGITGSMAFHMILFQAFSRNEEYLLKEKYLTPEGELHIFTSPKFNGINWVNIDFEKLIEKV